MFDHQQRSELTRCFYTYNLIQPLKQSYEIGIAIPFTSKDTTPRRWSNSPKVVQLVNDGSRFQIHVLWLSILHSFGSAKLLTSCTPLSPRILQRLTRAPGQGPGKPGKWGCELPPWLTHFEWWVLLITYVGYASSIPFKASFLWLKTF